MRLMVTTMLIGLAASPALAGEFHGGPVLDARHDASETKSASATAGSVTTKETEKKTRTCVTNNVTRTDRPTMPASSPSASASGLVKDMSGAAPVSAGAAPGLDQAFAGGGAVIGGQTNLMGLVAGAVSAFAQQGKAASQQLGKQQMTLSAWDQGSAAGIRDGQALSSVVSAGAGLGQAFGQRLATQVQAQSGAAATTQYDPAKAASLFGGGGGAGTPAIPASGL